MKFLLKHTCSSVRTLQITVHFTNMYNYTCMLFCTYVTGYNTLLITCTYHISIRSLLNVLITRVHEKRELRETMFICKLVYMYVCVCVCLLLSLFLDKLHM